jgi:hydroxymethylbilane synthase
MVILADRSGLFPGCKRGASKKSMERIVIGTRGSALALAQSEIVKAELLSRNPSLTVEIRAIKTEGDRKQGTPLAAQSDKKDWIIDLERALLASEIDLALHCGKDVPAELERGTEVHSILKRATPFDVFIGRRQSNGQRIAFANLPPGAIIGTASLRRRASLLSYRSDLAVREHRGNVPTRIQKLDDSPDLSGIIIAAAGLERLGLQDVVYEIIDRTIMLPSMNQGALAVQIRQGDARIHKHMLSLVDRNTAAEFAAERAVSEVLGGDCHSAISIFAEARGNSISIAGRVFAKDGLSSVSHTASAPIESAIETGMRVGQELLARGGATFLA